MILPHAFGEERNRFAVGQTYTLTECGQHVLHPCK
jgi:hypothetical protein